MTTIKSDPERRCARLDDWPPSDREAWRLATGPSDPFNPGAGVASKWTPKTRLTNEKGYGRWLGWLEWNRMLDPAAMPRDRATSDRVRAYLIMLQEKQYAPYTISGRLQQLGTVLRAMEPSEDWDWILRAASRLHAQARPIKDLSERMLPPQEILRAGYSMMGAIDDGRGRTALQAAERFRDGLMLALMTHRPLRIDNFASILLGGHLQLRNGWWLSFSREEMKAGRPFTCPWPDELQDALGEYLRTHRALLLNGRSTNKLWIGRSGNGMTAAAIAHRIRKHTFDALGVVIHPHAFRNISATTIAMNDPENASGIAGVLGHANLSTSERHYNMAKMLDANARYQDTLRTMRGAARARFGRSGRPASRAGDEAGHQT